MSLLLKNCNIINPDSSIFADILIEDGKIKAIGSLEKKADEIIDINNKLVMPGFIDLHAHFRDPGFTHKEDLYTGSLAALAGGFTSVNLMANTSPVVDNREVYEQVLEKAEKTDLINIYQCMAVTKGMQGQEPIDFDNIPDDLHYFSEDGKGLTNSRLAYEVFKNVEKTGKGIMIHAEDHNLTDISNRYAEDLETIRDCYLSKITGAGVHFCHVSTIDSLRAIKNAKDENLRVTCEVTPHHIYMKDDDYKVNPSIRTEEDRKYIIEMIKEGVVDAIATDHAPHTPEDKQKGAPGMIGLETAFNIVYKVLKEENNISINKIVELMSTNPAKIMNLNKGYLYPGFDADIVVVDEDKEITFDKFNSKSSNSPFLGQKFKSTVELTIVAGKIKFINGGLNDNR
ncbi:MAG: dihydroorotase [Finegoldia sp.]|nr:dihydroorotase [Finegoldia sp.]